MHFSEKSTNGPFINSDDASMNHVAPFFLVHFSPESTLPSEKKRAFNATFKRKNYDLIPNARNYLMKMQK